METNDFTYQLNAYYGIFYPADSGRKILSLLADDVVYGGLNSNDAFIKVDGIEIFASLNSDKTDDEVSHGFIAVDHMTFNGPECEYPEDALLHIEPREMIKMEDANIVAVKHITNIYDKLITRSKKFKKEDRDIKMGWRILPCAWDESSENSQELVEQTIVESKKALKKQAAKSSTNTPMTARPSTLHKLEPMQEVEGPLTDRLRATKLDDQVKPTGPKRVREHKK